MGPCDGGTASNSVIQWIRFQSPNGTYIINDTIDIRVFVGYNYISDGNPNNNEGYNTDDSHTLGHSKIRLATGGESDGFADLSDFDGVSAHWTEYRYTVRAGDNTSDLDYDSTRAMYYVVRHGGTTERVEDGENGRLRCYLPEPGGPGSLAAHADIGLDGIVPRVVNVTVSSPDGGYVLGDSIEFGVNFDDTVVYSGAAPVLMLNLSGGETRNATYTSGNNTNRLTFAYAVSSGDDAPNVEYNGTMALTTAGNMTDRIGNAANLTLSASGSLGRSGPVPIDATRPTVLSVASPNGTGPHTEGSIISVRAMFSENVDVDETGGTPRIALSTGAAVARYAEYDAAASTARTLAFSYNVTEGDETLDLDYAGDTALSENGGIIRDTAGNRATDLALPDPVAAGPLGALGPIRLDAKRPTVESVSSTTPAGTYGIDSRIVVTVAFSEDVDVDETGGTPRIALDTGSAGRYAVYDAAASTAQTLAFSYNVTEGDDTADLDYTAAAVILPNGGTIQDAAGNDADLDLPQPGTDGLLDSGTIRLEAVRPTADSVSSTTPAGTYAIGSTIVIEVTFSEDVDVDETGGTPRIALDTGSAGRYAVYDAAASTAQTLAFSYNVTEGDDTADLDYTAAAVILPNGGTIQDAAGNDADLDLPQPGTDGLLDSGTIRLEAVRPEVEYVYSEKDNYLYPAGTAIDVRVKLSEAVIVNNASGTPSIRLETGTTDRNATLTGGNNSDTLVFSYTVRQGDKTDDLNYTGTTALSTNGGIIRDEAGNDADLELPEWGADNTLGERNNIAVDAVAPEVVSAEAEFLDRIRVTFDDPVASGSLNASAGWSVSGPSAANLSIAVLGPVVPTSAPLTEIVFALNDTLPDTAPDLELSYDASEGGIADEAGNPLRGRTGIDVADLIRPSIDEALITGDREITIDYTEPVAASQGAYSGLEIGGASRTISPHDTAALRQHVIGFAGEPAPIPEPPSSMTVDGRAVLDGADSPNPLGDGVLTVDIQDGRVLDIFSSRITGPDTAVITYTRNTEAPLEAYSSLVAGGQNRTIMGLDGGGGNTHSHTLTFAPGGAQPNATGSVEIDGTAVVSPGSNMTLGSGTIQRTLDDGQSPSVRSATAVSLDTIRVSFSEPMLAPGAGAGGWSVSGRDAEGLAVASSQDAAEPSNSLDLTLGGDLPDTAPGAITLSYRPAAGGNVEDAAGNGLVASSTSVTDGIAPEVRSAIVSGPNEAEIQYTEPVWAAAGAYASVTLSSGGGLRPVSSLEGNGTAVHTVAFGGDPAAPGEAGVLEMDATAVIDAARLPLGTDAALPLDLAGAAPQQGNATARAAFTARNTVTITYSAALGPPAGHDGPVYAAVEIDAEDGGSGGGGAHPVSSVEGLGTAVHTIEFGGDGVGRNQTGTITLAVDLEGTGGQGVDPPRFAAGEIQVAPGRTLETVLVAQTRPPPVSIEPDGFTRVVDGTAAGGDARLAINVTGLAGTSGAPGTATFPTEAVVLTASFGTVTFPPGVTATSVPSAGALYLYVDDGGTSDEAATAALGYPSSGGMVLRTIVEAGGGADGDGRITFDMPVRISLDGQAGGRAFYIEGGADGAIMPIDLACAADDTERVHRQLNGAGECRIESADGGDMVIHTYHLTRFGTAASERGTPPPVDHTCSMRLGSERLDAQARPGDYSNAAEQAVINSGSLSFSSVELGATPWSVTPLPGAPVQNATSPLPANATLLSTAGSNAGFVPLPAGGAAAVASGLGGGLEVPLWFMLNLTGHAQVEGAELAQRATYTAECAGAG